MTKIFDEHVTALRELSDIEPPHAMRALASLLRGVQSAGRPPGGPRPDLNGAEGKLLTYLIGTEQDKYITRTLMPRVDGCRTMIHSIHREDRDRHPHDHPWEEAVFLVVDGGYTDERWFFDETAPVGQQWRFTRTLLLPGDVNYLRSTDYHRALEVRSNTLTIGVVSARVQDWGFMVDGVKIPHEQYRSLRQATT